MRKAITVSFNLEVEEDKELFESLNMVKNKSYDNKSNFIKKALHKYIEDFKKNEKNNYK